MLQKIKNAFYKKFRTSFAKSGIDLQVFQILRQYGKGFYVDVGSHHPITGSNTFFFYLLGWRGICIDPNPNFAPMYKDKRPNDIFLNIGVSDTVSKDMNYYKLKNELSERNSFSKEYIYNNNLQNDIDEIIPVKIRTLAEIFTSNNIPAKGIDFLTVDCEGLDLQVLKSNDWNTYRPRIVIIETHDTLDNDMVSSPVQFMSSVGYKLIGKTIQGEHVGILVFAQK